MTLTALLLLAAASSPEISIELRGYTKEKNGCECVMNYGWIRNGGELGDVANSALMEHMRAKQAAYLAAPKAAADFELRMQYNSTPSEFWPTLISSFSFTVAALGPRRHETSFDTLNFGYVQGKIKRLSLKDISLGNRDPRPAISRLVLARLRRNESLNLTKLGDTLRPEMADRFYVTREGLVWPFTGDEVGAQMRGAGNQVLPYMPNEIVEIPWSELAPLLDPEGPLKGIMPAQACLEHA